ncbi:MAG: 16S rRNA (cytidine(1402)-2'-O)-methyltransferase [Ruminococcaceae bacterium]|nr:16S rRNA (cytidine(1402)-2'-O)-methyltransferase [Oscillospiraceae bacterium]
MSYHKRNLTTDGKNAILGGVLYLVATPIGNLADISERALKVLSEVDFVAAEDTRNSGLLLSRFGISKPMISYFEHNKRERGMQIIERLKNGESCALITDAGTPAISDPGEDIVRLCAENGVTVTSIPGCCAAITALTLSGLSTTRFVFEGFLSTSKSERRERLDELSGDVRTMIFYEAPHKLRTTLDDLLKHFGDRQVALCREITKLNEEICRTTIAQAVEIYKEREPRGEYVLVVAGASKDAGKTDYPEDPVQHVEQLISEGMSKMDAIKAAAKARGVSKNEVYSLVMKKDEE